VLIGEKIRGERMPTLPSAPPETAARSAPSGISHRPLPNQSNGRDFLDGSQEICGFYSHSSSDSRSERIYFARSASRSRIELTLGGDLQEKRRIHRCSRADFARVCGVFGGATATSRRSTRSRQCCGARSAAARAVPSSREGNGNPRSTSRYDRRPSHGWRI